MKCALNFFACLMFGTGLAAAQDSVSKRIDPPGDAIAPYNTGEQQNDYVVDITAFQSSWGTTFGVAPIVKGSEAADYVPAPYFTHLMSSQAISRDTLSGVPFLRSSYDFWNDAGFGVHPDSAVNDPGVPIDTSSMVGSQFGVMFSEFGFGTASNSLNNLIGGVVNFEADLPSRLYVSRVVGGINSPDYSCNVSQFGSGGVDAHGNMAIRTDGYGSSDGCGYLAVTGQNYIRINAGLRGATLNIIDDAGGSDTAASGHVVINSGTTHIVPTLVPESLAGRPLMIGTDFSSSYVYEGAPLTPAYSTAHLPPLVGSTRGVISHSTQSFPSIFGAATVNGTAATLGRLTAGTGEVTEMLVWGLTANGDVAGTMGLPLPVVLTDLGTGWMSNALGSGPLEFGDHSSQSTYRGGNGQVGVGRDQAGNLIAAAVVDHPNSSGGGLANPYQCIAVARITPASVVTWSIAAYNDNTLGTAGTGKPILDGPGGAVVGRLVELSAVSAAGLTGPSMTPPMVDSVGNIYFVAAVERFITGGSEFDTALIRAVYDSASFSYELEEVFGIGDVFHGPNSDRNWQIRFIDIADSNSISSAAAFSGNISGETFNGTPVGGLETSDSRTLGGLIINAQIVYDVDEDGAFDLQTGSTGDLNSVDEDYRVLLYLTSANDCNENGLPDDLEIAQGAPDIDGDGIPDDCQSFVGQNYCTSLPNSTGAAAIISAIGSDSVSTNILTLHSLPVPDQPGIFFYGLNQAQIPFGNGFLCATGSIKRLPPTVAVGNEATYVLDFPSLVFPINPGDTWNFQHWYRDPGLGAHFNTSDGLQILFTP